MRWMIAVILTTMVLVSGCTMTGKDHYANLQAEVAALRAENRAMNVVNTQQQQMRTSLFEDLKLLFELWMSERRPHSPGGGG